MLPSNLPSASATFSSIISLSSPTDHGVKNSRHGARVTPIKLPVDGNGFISSFPNGLNSLKEISHSSNLSLGRKVNSNPCSWCHAQPSVARSGVPVNPIRVGEQ
jgi:hypothetical protein